MGWNHRVATMADTFGELIEKYGVPGLLIPNKGSYVITDSLDNGVRSLGSKVSYDRTPYGEAPFLLIKAYLEIRAGELNRVLADLETFHIVELRHGTKRGPRGGTINIVLIAIAADVSEFSQEELNNAMAEQRLVGVASYRSMGDGYVNLHLITPNLPVDEYGYYFLFKDPCRLTEEELPYAEAFTRDSAWDFFEAYKHYYIRFC